MPPDLPEQKKELGIEPSPPSHMVESSIGIADTVHRQTFGKQFQVILGISLHSSRCQFEEGIYV